VNEPGVRTLRTIERIDVLESTKQEIETKEHELGDNAVCDVGIVALWVDVR